MNLTISLKVVVSDGEARESREFAGLSILGGTIFNIKDEILCILRAAQPSLKHQEGIARELSFWIEDFYRKNA